MAQAELTSKFVIYYIPRLQKPSMAIQIDFAVAKGFPFEKNIWTYRNTDTVWGGLLYKLASGNWEIEVVLRYPSENITHFLLC